MFIFTQSDFTGRANTNTNFISGDGNITSFGNSISMSSDYQWLYVGAPDSDTVLTYHGMIRLLLSTDTFIVTQCKCCNIYIAQR
jgi:hypothetical protein